MDSNQEKTAIRMYNAKIFICVLLILAIVFVTGIPFLLAWFFRDSHILVIELVMAYVVYHLSRTVYHTLVPKSERDDIEPESKN